MVMNVQTRCFGLGSNAMESKDANVSKFGTFALSFARTPNQLRQVEEACCCMVGRGGGLRSPGQLMNSTMVIYCRHA